MAMIMCIQFQIRIWSFKDTYIPYIIAKQCFTLLTLLEASSIIKTRGKGVYFSKNVSYRPPGIRSRVVS